MHIHTVEQATGAMPYEQGGECTFARSKMVGKVVNETLKNTKIASKNSLY
jgi:hypothetical protein